MANSNIVTTPTPSYNFQVSVDKFSSDSMFSEVGGISVEIEIESYQEGGNMSTVHHLPKGIKRSNLVLKRGVTPIGSTLSNWCIKATNLDSFPIETRVVTVMLMGQSPDTKDTLEVRPLHTWTFYDAYPVKWQISEFVAEKSAYAIESIEFVYSSMSADV